MKILLVDPFYFPNMEGGAEFSTKLLAESLSKNNEVAIFSIDSCDYDKIETINNVKVFRYKSNKFKLFDFTRNNTKMSKFKKMSQKMLTYYNNEIVKMFRKTLQEFKPDILHTSSLYGIPFKVWKAAKEMNIPVVHTIRDTAIVSPVTYGHRSNFFINLFHKKYVKKYTSYVDAVTAPSNYTLNSSLTGNFKNAIIKECVFNSIELNDEILKKNIDEKLSKEDTIIKFMYAGRLLEIKGIKTMVAAFKKVQNENIELHICGDGDLKQYVIDESKKNNKIKFYGKLSKEELAKKYYECDVLIVPSEWPEPFGRVLIEANYYGMPVIANNVGGMPEIIENMDSGIIYDYTVKNSLEDVIAKMCNRQNITNYIINIKKNIKKYDIDIQVSKYMQIYINLINKNY